MQGYVKAIGTSSKTICVRRKCLYKLFFPFAINFGATYSAQSVSNFKG